MQVKEAVKTARDYALEVFEGETIRIEEVWFDEETTAWCVTVGLQRPEPSTVFDPLGTRRETRMHYKTVRISDATKKILSVLNHDKMPVSPR